MTIKNAPSEYLITKYSDGEDCTAIFDYCITSVFPSWADQESNEASRSLLFATLGVKAIPYEGTPRESISFRLVDNGFGFCMHYEVSDLAFTSGEMVLVSNIRVYRDTRWDEVEPSELDELKARVAELEAEVAKKDAALETLGQLLMHEKAETVRNVLDGGPEVSKSLANRVRTFEGDLRMLAYKAYSIQLDLAKAGHQKDSMWAFGSRRFKVMGDQLEDYVKRYFGGYNYPTD